MVSKTKNSKCNFIHELLHCTKIAIEYFRGIQKFKKLGPCITIYGSARISEADELYKTTVELARGLSNYGFTIMTGGGPGIMQAANYGAFNNKLSAGCSISIPYEQKHNSYLNFHHHCHYFFVRKVLLTKFSRGFIALPGGLGTLDELFEMLTLIKTSRMKDFPIILVGKSYWEPLIDFIHKHMISIGTVSDSEIKFISVTDDVEEAIKIVKKYHEI